MMLRPTGAESEIPRARAATCDTSIIRSLTNGPRSVIIADEDVVCYALSGADFAMLLHDKPAIAATVMRNTARELARRLRRTSEDLRQATS
jgi:CRP-like cAMP-binding protein